MCHFSCDVTYSFNTSVKISSNLCHIMPKSLLSFVCGFVLHRHFHSIRSILLESHAAWKACHRHPNYTLEAIECKEATVEPKQWANLEDSTIKNVGETNWRLGLWLARIPFWSFASWPIWWAWLLCLQKQPQLPN